MIPADYEARILAGESLEDILAGRDDSDKQVVEDAVMLFLEHTDLYGEDVDETKVTAYLLELLPEYSVYVKDSIKWESISRRNRSADLFESDSDHDRKFLGPTLIDGRRRFELLGKLGSGTQGTVYRAKDHGLKKSQRAVVAIKVFHNLNSLDGVQAPFVHHKNVVVVHDIGVDLVGTPTPYIVYEYLDGKTLSKWVSENDPVLSTVIDFMIQLCDGVQAMHTNMVVHRDLKPDNIIMVGDRPVVTDFGIAVSGLDDQSMAGSPMCMAPEQRTHVDDNALVDIYGLGAIGYYMITHRYPNGDTPAQSLSNLSDGSEVDCEGIPQSLREVLNKCLSRHPPERYESATALRADLEAIRDCRPTSVQRLTLASDMGLFARRRPAATAVILTLLAAVCVMWALSNKSSSKQISLLELQVEHINAMRKISMDGLIRGMVEIKADEDHTDPVIYLMLGDLGRGTDVNWWELSSLFNEDGELLIRSEIQKYRDDPTFSRIKLAYWYRALARVQAVLFEDKERAIASYANARNLLIKRLGEADPLIGELDTEIKRFVD